MKVKSVAPLRSVMYIVANLAQRRQHRQDLGARPLSTARRIHHKLQPVPYEYSTLQQYRYLLKRSTKLRGSDMRADDVVDQIKSRRQYGTVTYLYSYEYSYE